MRLLQGTSQAPPSKEQIREYVAEQLAKAEADRAESFKVDEELYAKGLTWDDLPEDERPLEPAYISGYCHGLESALSALDGYKIR